MKKKIVVSVLILGMSVGSLAYAFSGNPMHKQSFKAPRHEILAQLPEDKEMLFHKTMREVRDQGQTIKEQISQLKVEIKDILTAPEFNESLFVKKTTSLHELHAKRHEVMNKAIVNLAKQFTSEERKILAELIPPKHGRHGRHPMHRYQ